MIKRLLIVALGAAGCLLAQDLPSQARSAVSEKRFGEALTLYRTLLAGSPANVDYMLWIARLSAWTNDYTTAENFYDQALALEPKDVDALLGKATVLLWMHSYHEAFAVLSEAHELAPNDSDVELLWSRYYHWQGDDKDAKLHVEKSLAFNADNQEALDLKDSLVPDYNFALRIGFEGDTLPGTNPGAIEELDLTYNGGKNEIGLAYFHLSRYGGAGSRGGLHFSRKVGNLTTVRGAALFGGGGDIVPKQDLSVGASQLLRQGLLLGADYRHIVYPLLTVDAAIASLDYYFEKPMWIVASVAANRVEGATTPTFLLRYTAGIRKNLTLNAGYGHGTEIFQLALPTDFGAFRRDSYIGGMGLALSKKTRVEATYTLARRSTGVFENMYLLALVHIL